MANRAYLRCLQGRSNLEIAASYSVPDTWYDLFGPGDLHTGNECPIPGACKEHTTSYLLAEAPVALARFAARMRRGGVSLTGDGLTARLYAWLTTHFAEGWLFADTTEIEWMSGRVLADARKQLVTADKRIKRRELDDRSLLTAVGWGTGLSAEEAAEAIQEARRHPHDVTKIGGRPYKITDHYAVNDAVAHPIFGPGTVRAASETTITVAFPIGTKTLAHRRTLAVAPGPPLPRRPSRAILVALSPYSEPQARTAATPGRSSERWAARKRRSLRGRGGGCRTCRRS